MVRYGTLDDFRRFGRDLLAEERTQIVKSAAQRSPAGLTFLSHSSLDVEYLPGVIKLLENHGATVYTDKKDPTLPPTTSRDTASALKKRIESSRKFILFATENSSDSRWVPWELGISDGLKGSVSTAILPGVDRVTDTAWTRQEYLGIYNRVVWGDLEGEPEKVWMVWSHETNTATRLSRWLNS